MYKQAFRNAVVVMLSLLAGPAVAIGQEAMGSRARSTGVGAGVPRAREPGSRLIARRP